MKSSIVLALLPLLAASTQFSISGLSSGAYFAIQMEVAYSASCVGAGAIAGGPYYCSQGSLEKSSSDCMLLYDLIDISFLTNYTDQMAIQGYIDPTSNLASHKVYLFSGLMDTVVNQGVVSKLQSYLQTYISAGNIASEFSIPAENAFITDFYGGACAYLGVPYMNNCLYDSAGQILSTIYGSLNGKVESKLGNYYTFGQKEYFSSVNWEIASMADDGFVYVPSACQQDYSECKVHVVMHGCGQNYIQNIETVIHFAGYNEWAESNDIIILYPQAAITLETNPLACFDWWGYTNGDYALQKGVQMAGIYSMIQNLPKVTTEVGFALSLELHCCACEHKSLYWLMEILSHYDSDEEKELEAGNTPNTPVVSKTTSMDRKSESGKGDDEDLCEKQTEKRISLTPMRDEYNQYSVPPNFLYAVLHQKSHRVLQLAAKFDEDNEALDDYCPCCNYPIEGKLFPLLCNIRRLNELGSGFPLYYDMGKCLTGIVIVAMAVAGVYCLVRNYMEGKIGEYDPDLEGHLILTGTLANYGLSSKPSAIEPWLHTLSAVLILILYYCLTLRHKRLKHELDLTAITPSDYTVMLTNVPAGIDKSNFQEFLEENGRPDGIRCQVVKMNFVYRVSKLVDARRRLEIAKDDLAMAEQLQKQPLSPPLFSFTRVKLPVYEYQARIHALESDISSLESNEFSEFTEVAFVTFNQDEGD